MQRGAGQVGTGEARARARARVRAIAGALMAVLGLAGCAAEQTGAVLAPAAVSVPAEAPRTTGRQRPADSDHHSSVKISSSSS